MGSQEGRKAESSRRELLDLETFKIRRIYVKTQVSDFFQRERVLGPRIMHSLCFSCLPAILLIFDLSPLVPPFAICLTLWNGSSLGTGSSLSWSLPYPWQLAADLN